MVDDETGLIRARRTFLRAPLAMRSDAPLTAQQLVPVQHHLGRHAQHVQVVSIGQVKVPQLENFLKRWGPGAEGEDEWEGVQLGLEAL